MDTSHSNYQFLPEQSNFQTEKNTSLPAPDSSCLGREASLPVPVPLEQVLDLVIQLMDADKVFLLGTYEATEDNQKTGYDLLLSIPAKDARPHSDYMIIMEHISLKIHPVTAIVLSSHVLNKMLSAGHIYYSRYCRSQNLIFDSGRYVLPNPETIPVDSIIATAINIFNNRLQKSISFLNCSRHLFARGQKSLAAFMLHQCMEQVYRGMLQSLTGKEMVTHDLHLLMRHCRRCAPEICRVFLRGNEEDGRRLWKLQKAYINTRYKDNYLIGEDDMITLTDKADRLQRLAIEVFKIKIQEAAEGLHFS